MANEPSTVSSAPRMRSYPGTTSPIRSGDIEEADDSVQRRRFSGRIGKQPPLEMRKRRGRDRVVARRQFLDGARSEASEILGRSPECGEDRASRLVGQRDRDLGPGGQRLEQRPLGTGQILES